MSLGPCCPAVQPLDTSTSRVIETRIKHDSHLCGVCKMGGWLADALAECGVRKVIYRRGRCAPSRPKELRTDSAPRERARVSTAHLLACKKGQYTTEEILSCSDSLTRSMVCIITQSLHPAKARGRPTQSPRRDQHLKGRTPRPVHTARLARTRDIAAQHPLPVGSTPCNDPRCRAA